MVIIKADRKNKVNIKIQIKRNLVFYISSADKNKKSIDFFLNHPIAKQQHIFKEK